MPSADVLLFIYGNQFLKRTGNTRAFSNIRFTLNARFCLRITWILRNEQTQSIIVVTLKPKTGYDRQDPCAKSKSKRYCLLFFYLNVKVVKNETKVLQQSNVPKKRKIVVRKNTITGQIQTHICVRCMDLYGSMKRSHYGRVESKYDFKYCLYKSMLI